MRLRVLFLSILSAALLAVALPAAAPAGCSASYTDLEEIECLEDGRGSCVYEGVRHNFIVYLPEAVERSPLILALHGYGQTAESFRLETALEQDANPRGYTLVYVTGGSDPADRTSSSGWNAGGASVKPDTAFLVALADYIQRSYHTDAARTYAVGFSNGAFMAHRLALEAGDRFAAVVSVAGTVEESVWAERPETCRVGLLQITGEKDTVVPKDSDGSARYAKSPAIEDVIAYYASANGLTQSETLACGKGSVLTKYTGDGADRQVWHLLVRDGRHSWSAERFTGINTNRLILDFLDAQQS